MHAYRCILTEVDEQPAVTLPLIRRQRQYTRDVVVVVRTFFLEQIKEKKRSFSMSCICMCVDMYIMMCAVIFVECAERVASSSTARVRCKAFYINFLSTGGEVV